MTINNLKKALNKKEPVQFDDDELKYSLKPLGRSHMRSKIKVDKLCKENTVDLDDFSIDTSSSDTSTSYSIDETSSEEEVLNKPKYKRITCELCGKQYNTTNSGKHRATKYHQLYANMNKRLLKLLTD